LCKRALPFADWRTPKIAVPPIMAQFRTCGLPPQAWHVRKRDDSSRTSGEKYERVSRRKPPHYRRGGEGYGALHVLPTQATTLWSWAYIRKTWSLSSVSILEFALVDGRADPTINLRRRRLKKKNPRLWRAGGGGEKPLDSQPHKYGFSLRKASTINAFWRKYRG
jgi:hypothetical protein